MELNRNPKTKEAEQEHTPYHQPRSAEDLISQNVASIDQLEKAAQRNQDPVNRVADIITRFCGSMTFVWVHVGWFTLWIVANTKLMSKPLDPFPFNFLTLVVSLEAIFLSTFILISENRKAKIDERRSHLDLQINLLAEQENTKTLQLLKQIAEKLGIECSDPGISVLEKATRPAEVLKQIDQMEEKPESFRKR